MTVLDYSRRVAEKVLRCELSRIAITQRPRSRKQLDALVLGIMAGAYCKLGRTPGRWMEDARLYLAIEHAIICGRNLPDALREGGLGIPVVEEVRRVA